MSIYDVIKDPKIREEATNYLQATCLSFTAKELMESGEIFLGSTVSLLAKYFTNDFLFSDLSVGGKIRSFIDNVYDILPFDDEQRVIWTKKRLVSKLFNMYYDIYNLEPYILSSIDALLQNDMTADGLRSGTNCEGGLKAKFQPSNPELVELEYKKACENENDDMRRFLLAQMSRYVIPESIDFFGRILEFFKSLFQRNLEVEQHLGRQKNTCEASIPPLVKDDNLMIE